MNDGNSQVECKILAEEEEACHSSVQHQWTLLGLLRAQIFSFSLWLSIAPQFFLQLFISGTKAKCLAVSQIKRLSSSSQEKVE